MDDKIIVHLLDANSDAVCRDSTWQHGVSALEWASTEGKCPECVQLATPELIETLRAVYDTQRTEYYDLPFVLGGLIEAAKEFEEVTLYSERTLRSREKLKEAIDRGDRYLSVF